jgi:hypothetical protein
MKELFTSAGKNVKSVVSRMSTGRDLKIEVLRKQKDFCPREVLTAGRLS